MIMIIFYKKGNKDETVCSSVLDARKTHEYQGINRRVNCYDMESKTNTKYSISFKTNKIS